MASKIIAFAALVAACNAVPIWFNEVLPGTIVRVGRAPTISYAYGTGLSSNINGVKNSFGIGSAFNSGGGDAYARGVGITDGGFAQGVGLASAGNSQPVYQVQPTYTIARPTYGNAVASAHNFGGANLAQSTANSGNGQAISYAQNLRGLQYGPTIASASAANDGFGNQNTISSAHTSGLGYNSHAVSASENHGNYRGSTAQTYQQRGNTVQQSGATSIDAPGFKAAHSHAVQTGFY